MDITRDELLHLIESYVADGNSWHALAMDSGMSYANLMDFKRGKASLPRDKNITKLMAILRPELNLAADSSLLLLTGYVGDGAHVTFTHDHPTGMAEPKARSGFGSAPRPAALEVRGDSLLPLITAGFRLIYGERMHGVPEEYLGKICVVKLVDGPCLVKRIKKGSSIGRYHLLSLSPSEKPIENAAIEWSAFVTQLVQG